jgi:uncharacterized membrane-anchored protein YitT (DUF2179 family)
MVRTYKKPTALWHYLRDIIWMGVGAFLAAVAIRIFLFPNHLIDGGTIGIGLILARLFGETYLPYFLIALNIPFIYLAYRYIRPSFVFHMLVAIILFAVFLALLEKAPSFSGEPLEIIAFGGAILGVGAGMIIRNGGCVDGTEILAIIVSRKRGFTIGQVVLFANIFIFGLYGWIFKDWHIALQSLLTYVVAFKMIDLVIVGLDELKSVLILSSKPAELSKILMQEMGVGLTVIHGRGGFSGAPRDLLFMIVERLDIAELKEIVLREDPRAFMAIENLHEAVAGKQANFMPYRKRNKRRSLNK